MGKKKRTSKDCVFCKRRHKAAFHKLGESFCKSFPQYTKNTFMCATKYQNLYNSIKEPSIINANNVESIENANHDCADHSVPIFITQHHAPQNNENCNNNTPNDSNSIESSAAMTIFEENNNSLFLGSTSQLFALLKNMQCAKCGCNKIPIHFSKTIWIMYSN